MRERLFWAVTLFLMLASVPAFSAQLTFTPRISFIEEYNDNVDLDRKDKIDDFITTVSPGFTAEMFEQTAGLRVSYDPAYSFYADHSEFDGWSHRALGNIWNDFSRATRFELTNHFIYSKDPLADDDVEDDQGNILIQGNERQGQRDTYYRNYATARLNHHFGAEDSVYARFAHGIWKYDDPNEQDGQEFSPSSGLTYWLSNWWGMELEGGYTRGLYDENDQSDFDNYFGRTRLKRRFSPQFGLYGEYKQIYRKWDDPDSTTGTNGQLEEDYLVYAPSVGGFYQFDPTLTSSLGIGWFYQQIENGDDEYGPFLSALINKLWDWQRWSIRLRGLSGLGSQDFSDDNEGFERFALTELIGRYNFTRQLFGDLRLRYRYSDFINSEDDEKDHRYTVDAGLGYQVFRWMTVRLAYAFNKLDAINSTEDYEQNRVYATITLQPDLPWRFGD